MKRPENATKWVKCNGSSSTSLNDEPLQQQSKHIQKAQQTSQSNREAVTAASEDACKSPSVCAAAVQPGPEYCHPFVFCAREGHSNPGLQNYNGSEHRRMFDRWAAPSSQQSLSLTAHWLGALKELSRWHCHEQKFTSKAVLCFLTRMTQAGVDVQPAASSGQRESVQQSDH